MKMAELLFTTRNQKLNQEIQEKQAPLQESHDPNTKPTKMCQMWNWCIKGLHLTLRLGTFSFDWHKDNGWRERNAILAHVSSLLGTVVRIFRVIIKEMFIIGFQLLESNLKTK